MMDVMDAVLTLIKSAPHLAIWILLILYGFKVVVIGSIYATIRYVVDRVATAIERARATRCTTLVLEVRSGRLGTEHILMHTAADDFIDFVKSLRTGSNNYVHASDIQRARAALGQTRTGTST